MKKKYRKGLILDYVNGEEIEDIDELEDNVDFMMEVIQFTHDKKMYHMCSSHVKKQYEFVKFMIQLFSDDKEFIIHIANDYLSTVSREEISYIELNIIMSRLLSYEDLGESDKIDRAIYDYHLNARTFLTYEQVQAQALQQDVELSLQRELGLGFRMIQYQYGNSDIIMEYAARDYLMSILKEHENMSFEAFIHCHYASFDQVKEEGIHHFLLRYIALYDSNLADYVSVHLYLLKDMLDVMQQIDRSWDSFEENNFYQKTYLFEEYLRHKIDEEHLYFNFLEYCIHLDKMDLGLPFSLVDYYYDDVEPDSLVDIMEDYVDLNHDIYLREIASKTKKIFSSKVMTQQLVHDILGDEYSKKTKILAFPK